MRQKDAPEVNCSVNMVTCNDRDCVRMMVVVVVVEVVVMMVMMMVMMMMVMMR